MQIALEQVIADYFRYSNAHDADGLASLFAENGRAHDEQADHRGREAIRNWADETFSKYGMQLEPLAAREEDGATIVTSKVSGRFPGSPIELDFRFVTESGRIEDLRIG